ncbi:MAG: TIGR00730 family Rossman fold protein [Armatimonadota bacterium]
MIICVYSSSSNNIDSSFFDVATELGKAIADDNHTLIYGGATVGLMGAVADAVKLNGGEVIGVLPSFMQNIGIEYTNADELVITEGMRDRKAVMESRADAFIALPGGFGTLEEMLEVITLKQLGLHNKPIVFINQNGFYDDMINMFEKIFENHFAKPKYRILYHFANDIKDCMNYIDSYKPMDELVKWF